jgi:hypothetical protein
MSGTALPLNILMAAKLLILCYLVDGQLSGVPDGFLPFISVLGYFNGSEPYRHALQAVIVTSAVVLWLNRAPRTCCMLIGCTFLLAILSSQVYYHNNLLYLGLFFFIIGLWDSRLGTLLLRLQLAVLYFGAGLNKVLLSDWRTGRFVQSWLTHYPTRHLYAHASALLPGMLLSALLGWLAILTEFALIPLLLIRRYVQLAVLIGISYHTGLVLITGGSTFNMFWFALVATYIALLDWPSRLLVSYNPERGLHRIAHSVLAPVDADRLATWHPSEVTRLELTADSAEYTGIVAGARLLLYSPAFYISCAIIFNLTLFHWHDSIIPFVTYGLILAICYGYVDRIGATRAASGRHARQKP